MCRAPGQVPPPSPWRRGPHPARHGPAIPCADFRRRVLTAYVGEEVLGLLGEGAVFDLARRHALRDFLTSQRCQRRALALQNN